MGSLGDGSHSLRDHGGSGADAIDRLEQTAQAFLAESARLQEAAAATATASNEGATVTVDAAGRLVEVSFSPDVTSPDRWNHWFGEAYTRALTERPPFEVSTVVPGHPGQPPTDRPRAPEQDIVAAQIRADQERAEAHMQTPQETSATSASSGVSVTVNALEVIIDAQASTEALRDNAQLGGHVMAAYRAACLILVSPTA